MFAPGESLATDVLCTPALGVSEGGRLWYLLDAPPKVGLPQPIRQLFDRLTSSGSA